MVAVVREDRADCECTAHPRQCHPEPHEREQVGPLVRMRVHLLRIPFVERRVKRSARIHMRAHARPDRRDSRARTNAPPHTYARGRASASVCMRACAHVRVHACVRACAHVRVHACERVCVRGSVQLSPYFASVSRSTTEICTEMANAHIAITSIGTRSSGINASAATAATPSVDAIAKYLCKPGRFSAGGCPLPPYLPSAVLTWCGVRLSRAAYTGGADGSTRATVSG